MNKKKTTKTAKKGAEQRAAKRFSVKVLVTCLPANVPSKRNGHATRGWEMWARDMADDGVGLRWDQQWSAFRSQLSVFETEKPQHVKPVSSEKNPADSLKVGQKVHLDGLVYDDEGTKLMEGTIRWIRSSKKGDKCDVGVYITTPAHREYFRTLQH